MGVRAEATVSLRDARLPADVDGPDDATGVVLFAHGSGSSRHSPRNVAVARVLQRRRLVTVLVDLLTAEEEAVDARTAVQRFDIDLLAGRLAGTVDWLTAEPALGRLPVGLFGASTGAAAALVTAAGRPQRIAAVVSRGGRPDLAGPALAGVRAPTLLLVGGRDDQVTALNEQAAERLTAPHELRVVPGAGHLFEEPGTLDQVADAAAEWFTRHLSVPA
ncbi:dienelactone hydrolase family protein [Micromonospora sp. WMMD714]|uniref:dienelactone hydrolase family protein n=1 Tax=Micromonospora sp. WMMD714 TaxID=3016097 RepID=UPI002499B44D|nr:dienelactone hydrolase family protein [Micromonospora sp. WMMD714]WFE63647.1 dienelactone hydrolase family protein [Micromonospora sp. WMMD714]